MNLILKYFHKIWIVGSKILRCLNEIIELENLAKIEASESSIKEKLNYIIPISKESTVEYERILGDLKKLEP